MTFGSTTSPACSWRGGSGRSGHAERAADQPARQGSGRAHRLARCVRHAVRPTHRRREPDGVRHRQRSVPRRRTMGGAMGGGDERAELASTSPARSSGSKTTATSPRTSGAASSGTTTCHPNHPPSTFPTPPVSTPPAPSRGTDPHVHDVCRSRQAEGLHRRREGGADQRRDHAVLRRRPLGEHDRRLRGLRDRPRPGGARHAPRQHGGERALRPDGRTTNCSPPTTTTAGPITISDASLAAALAAKGVGTPPAPVVFDPVSIVGIPQTSGFVDDPICAANGNMIHQDTDLDVPVGRGCAEHRAHVQLGRRRP